MIEKFLEIAVEQLIPDRSQPRKTFLEAEISPPGAIRPHGGCPAATGATR